MSTRTHHRGIALPTLLALAVLALACGSGRRDDPILRLSATESLEQGKVLLEAEKYREARKYLIHAFEVEPNSSAGREGLLLAADALFLQGGMDTFVEAETRYRDFINRFPTSPRADYAQYRLAMSLARRMEKPNRDQQTTRKALDEFARLMRSYPTSEWVDDAQLEMETVKANLVEHELVVANFYLRYGNLGGAIERAKYVLENYPEYSEHDRALYIVCHAYSRAGQVENAGEWCGRLREEHPESELIAKIKEPRRVKARKERSPAPAADEAESDTQAPTSADDEDDEDDEADEPPEPDGP
ncbi:MAG TPA: outer membrane protein assembly factor BamD [Thermoanaerobaculia bacterium]|nr:outer membrane protein assembly factor BamD [Thermoanaerobaculia bacterium]